MSEIICCAGREWNIRDPFRWNVRLGIKITAPPEKIAEVVFSRINNIVAEQTDDPKSFFYIG